jgi:hypothetical protein
MHDVARQEDVTTQLLEAQHETNRLLALILERLSTQG